MQIRTWNKIALSFSFICFGMFPFFPEYFESYVPISLLSLSFLVFLTDIKKEYVLHKEFFVTASIFLLFLLSWLWSEDIDRGKRRMETMLSLMGMPVSFYVFLGIRELNWQHFQKLFFRVFFFSNVVYSIIAMLFISNYRNPKFPNKDASFYRSALADIPLIGEHPIYVSLFIAVSVLIGIWLFEKSRSNIEKTANVICGLILLSFLVVLMSKGVILGLMCALLIFFLNRFRKVRPLVYAGIVVAIILLAIIPESNNRFKEVFSAETYQKVDLRNSTSIRLNIWKCALEKIGEAPLLGHGLGDTQTALSDCYESKGFNFKDTTYNSHNQYFYVWLSAGIAAFLAFILVMLFYLKVGIRSKDYLMVSLMVLFLTAFLFENVLSRQSGVILFSFLMNFMAIKNLSEQKNGPDTLN